MRRVQVQVTDEQAAHLERRARVTGTTVASALRAAIDAQLAADERQRRIKVALAALEKPAFHSILTDPSESHEESIVRAIEERIGRR